MITTDQRNYLRQGGVMDSFKTSSCLASESEMKDFAELLFISSGDVGFSSGPRAYELYNKLESSEKGLPAIAAGVSQRVINACREKCLRYPSVIKLPSLINPQESVSIIIFMYLDQKIRSLAKEWINNSESSSKSFDDYPSKTRSTEDLLAFYGLHKPLEAYLSAVEDPLLTIEDLNNAYWGVDAGAAKNKILSRAYLITKEKITAQWRFMEDVRERASEALKKRTLTVKKRRNEEGKVVSEKSARYEVSDSAAKLRVLINRMQHSNSDNMKKGIKGLTFLQAIHRGKRVRESWITNTYKQGRNEVLSVEDIAWMNAKKVHEQAKLEQDRCLTIFESAKKGVESVYTIKEKTAQELNQLKAIQKTFFHFLLSFCTLGIVALYRHVICLNRKSDIENSSITLGLAVNYKDESEKKLKEAEDFVTKTHVDVTERYEELKAMHKAKRDAQRQKLIDEANNRTVP